MNYKSVIRKTHRCGFCGTKTSRAALKNVTIEEGYIHLKCVNCNAIIHTLRAQKVSVHKRRMTNHG